MYSHEIGGIRGIPNIDDLQALDAGAGDLPKPLQAPIAASSASSTAGQLAHELIVGAATLAGSLSSPLCRWCPPLALQVMYPARGGQYTALGATRHSVSLPP